ncbi:rhodanese-like domain-containing protein [Cellvibrio sp. ARAG 10.3]|uniref:rhodanese-like domain-containing protein n=1 Tax=Cellvibrio sp. ARAG 10.3 TaxID=3451358 RepID=UPI003F4527BC
MNHKRIHPVELFANPSTNLCVLDVRTASEVAATALPGALHIPLHELTPERLQNELVKHGKQGSCVYLLCQGGKRAEKAADQLQGHVNAELCIIDGGMNAVQQANIPVTKNHRKTMSLEQQVRTAAGVLVLIGVILGTWMHPAFYGLSAFVGAGLVFAGITDLCAMGMLLARAPWNK